MYVCEKLQNLESDLNVKISDVQIFIYDNLGLEFIYVPEGEYIQGLIIINVHIIRKSQMIMLSGEEGTVLAMARRGVDGVCLP